MLMWMVIFPRGIYRAIFSRCNGPFETTLHTVIQKTSFSLKILWKVFHNLMRHIQCNEALLSKYFPMCKFCALSC